MVFHLNFFLIESLIDFLKNYFWLFFFKFFLLLLLTPEENVSLLPAVLAIWAKYWITFLVFSVLPAPLSPLHARRYITVQQIQKLIIDDWENKEKNEEENWLIWRKG